MSKKKIGLIVNPTAGTKKKARDSEEVILKLGEKAPEYKIVHLSDDTYELASQNAKNAVESGELAALIVVGGDGLVHLGFNAVVNTDVPLGIVPSGSGNDFVRSLHIPTNDIAKVVNGIIAGLREQAVLRVDAGHLQSIDDKQQPTGAVDKYFASILATGLDADIAIATNESAVKGNFFAYRYHTFSHIARMYTYDMRVSFKGVPVHEPLNKIWNAETDETAGKELDYVIEGDTTFVCVANSQYYGGGVKIAPDADITDGYFRVVYADKLSAPSAVVAFMKARSGNHLPHAHIGEYKTNRVILESRSGNVPTSISDGETAGQLPLLVTMASRAVPVLLHPKAFQQFG
ncbi:MAG: hypothetical protein LBL41_04635 [Bifidobacteriaceae bacterium]|jgi:diacylglycerol kinase (ATP)|nr:hypothetical protein [Bifidobacteriaceae bacterium]